MTLTRPDIRQVAGLETFYPHGLAADGATDDSAAINAAVVRASEAGGGVVMLPAGQYAVDDGIDLLEGVILRGAGIGATELVLTGTPAAMIDAAGSTSSAINVTSTVQPLSTVLPLADTSSLAAGDYLILYDDFAYNPEGANYRAGELVRVESVDSSTQVTLYSPVAGSMYAAGNYAYSSTNSPKVRKVNFIRGVGLESMTLTGDLDETVMLVRLKYCYDARVRNVHLRNGGSDGIRVNSCAESVIADSSWEDFTDNIPGGQSGYGIHIVNATDGLAIDNCHFTRLRHGVTTGCTGAPGVVDEPGIPHRIVVSNCTGKFTTAGPFDTHAAGDGILFSNCISYGSGTHGFSIRSVNTELNGCLVYGMAAQGITLAETLCRNIAIRNCTIRDSAGTAGHGIHASAGAVTGLRIQDCHIANIAKDGITIHGGSTDVVITDNTIARVGTSGTNQYGIVGNTAAGTGKWLIARNYLRATSGNWDVGISNSNLTDCYIVDNKAIGTFVTAAFSFGSDNLNLRNDVLDAGTITPAQITANQNNYAPSGYIGANKFRLSSDASRTLTGLAASGGNGREIFLFNVGGFDIVLSHDSASSTAANRFYCPNGASVTIRPNGWVQLFYDATSSRWRVMGA